MQNIYTGWITILFPIVYNKLFAGKDYVKIYFWAQAIFVFSECTNLFLATRYNQKLGIPDIVLYYIGGSIAQRLEMGLMIYPFMLILSKIFPVGIESTMYSFSMSVLILFAFCAPLFGVLINNNFVHVTTENMDNYVYLKIIRVISAFTPFYYMWFLVPTFNDVETIYNANI